MVALLDWSLITGTNDSSTVFTDGATGLTADVSVTSSAGWTEFNASGFGTTGFNYTSGATAASPTSSTIDFGRDVDSASFVLMDVDASPGNFADVITISAVDLNGDPVAVIFSDLEAYHQVTDNGDGTYTILATGNTSTTFDGIGAADSVTVSFAGPIASFTVSQSSTPGLTSGAVGVSDISFDILCFSRGSQIETPHGLCVVEDLNIGDLVLTKDSGVQAIKWIGRKRVMSERLETDRNLRPVRISMDAFGPGVPCRDMMVSPQHKILMSGWLAEVNFASSEILAPAKGLINDTTIRPVDDLAEIEYVHVMFEKHEIVTVDNLQSESFFAGDTAVSTLDQASRRELFDLFPELAVDQSSFGSAARKTLKVREAKVLSP